MPLADQPTCVRYRVMAFMCTLAFVLYIDRICIGQAAGKLMGELGLNTFEFSFVLIAFQISYGIFEPATGHWGDRYGSRRVLIRIVLWWSFFTALTGCVFKFSIEVFGVVVFNGFAMLIVIRFLFGAGEAGALPNAARVISCWFPPGRRGPAQALISTSAQIGAATAPALAAFLIDWKFIGWRWAFVIFGCLGVVWVWFFARWFRDDPATHPDVNEAERRYINAGRAPADAAKPASEHDQRAPWRRALTNRNIWLLGIINSCASFYSYMLFSWFPEYLKKGRGMEEGASGLLGSLPYIMGASGVLLGGYLGDWLTRRTGSRRLALCSMGTIGMLVAGVLVTLSIYCESPEASVVYCSVGFFFAYLQLAAWWACMADVGGRHLGALFGFCNMIGLVGGGISQLFLGWFVQHMKELGYLDREQWDPAFYVYGAVLMLGGVLWLFMNPRLKVAEEA